MAESAYKSILLAGLGCLLIASAAMAQSSASKDYLQDCAECHGADGKGEVEKRNVRGYVSTDLTEISKRNGGEFPSQKVYDAIDGRHRIAAHFEGDMPRWGARFHVDENNHSQSEQQVKDRISALVDYVESMQEK
jgi:hypothetical protein